MLSRGLLLSKSHQMCNIPVARIVDGLIVNGLMVDGLGKMLFQAPSVFPN